VTDAFVNFSGDFGRIKLCFSRDFPADDKKTMGSEAFYCDTAFGVLGQTRIKDGVGNLITDFIGVPAGDGFDCIIFEGITENIIHIVFQLWHLLKPLTSRLSADRQAGSLSALLIYELILIK